MTLHGKWSQPGVPHRGWVCVDSHAGAARASVAGAARAIFNHRG
jgi:hypothetical protein